MEFQRDDLQQDDIVYFNNGTTGKVRFGGINGEIIVPNSSNHSGKGYVSLTLYDKNLKHRNDSIGYWHIIKVVRPKLKEEYIIGKEERKEKNTIDLNIQVKNFEEIENKINHIKDCIKELSEKLNKLEVDFIIGKDK